MPADSALDAFENEVEKPDTEIDLGRASLVLGKFEYTDIDVDAYEERIAELADDAARYGRDVDLTPVALAGYLFDTQKYQGNEQDYLDPRNSYLNEVIDRRLGIPISLSVLFIEVAGKLDMDVQGVGLPGHFIVRAVENRGSQSHISYIDPFHRGKVMSQQDCRDRVRAITNDAIPFDPAFLDPVSTRYILMRMLNNLKNIYMARRDFARARHVVERLLVLSPENLDEVRNLGLLYATLGQSRRAVALLEKYLQGLPEAPDAESVKKYVAALAGNVARWN